MKVRLTAPQHPAVDLLVAGLKRWLVSAEPVGSEVHIVADVPDGVGVPLQIGDVEAAVGVDAGRIYLDLPKLVSAVARFKLGKAVERHEGVVTATGAQLVRLVLAPSTAPLSVPLGPLGALTVASG